MFKEIIAVFSKNNTNYIKDRTYSLCDWVPSGWYVQWLLGLKVVNHVKFLSKQLNDFTELVAESRVVFYKSALRMFPLPYNPALLQRAETFALRKEVFCWL